MIKTYKPNDTARVQAMFVQPHSYDDAFEWAGDDLRHSKLLAVDGHHFPLQVKTLEGWVDMPDGSYLIKGTNGEFYPCDPDVFENRWVEVEAE